MAPLRMLAVLLAFTAIASRSVLASGSAPADEYFGPFKESILEIRNRLIAFERDTPPHLHSNVRAIDNLETAVEDWYHKYPADPWIRGFSARLVRVYRRAAESKDVHCTRIVRIAILTARR